MQGRSRIELKNLAPRARSMPSVLFDVLLINGVFEWGPMNEATTCVDYSDFYKKFGRFLSSYEAPLQVKRFFDGGGRRAMVCRVCHVTDHEASSTPATAVKATYMFKTALGAYAYSDQNTLKVDALYYGARGNDISIKIQDATNGIAGQFDLLVYVDDVLDEWFKNLSMDSASDTYVEDIINTASSRSDWIRVDDQSLVGDEDDKRPKNYTTATDLAGGNDGLAALADADYVGAAAYHTGLYAFNLVEDGDILITPDKASSTGYQNSAISWCDTEKSGKVLFIAETPASTDSDAAVVIAGALTASEYRTGLYWPGIKIANPDKVTYGKADTITIRPCGSIAGRMAKNSINESSKMWTQPGNAYMGWLDGVVGVEDVSVKEPSIRDYVTDYRINPIMEGRRADGSYGVWLDDVQLGRGDFNFKSIGEGRGVAYLRKKLEKYLEIHRAQNNTETRRRNVKTDIEAELLQHMEMDAFISRDASEAFYVNTDPDGTGLNNPVVQDDETFKILVAVATARAARLIQLFFTRDARAVESWIQQQLASNA
jgi:hypothetical protein